MADVERWNGMWWFLLSVVVVVGFLAGVFWWSRSDDGISEEMPPVVPSGRAADRARAQEQMLHPGRGSSGPNLGL
jgi:uncharacterized membrane protein YqiK